MTSRKRRFNTTLFRPGKMFAQNIGEFYFLGLHQSSWAEYSGVVADISSWTNGLDLHSIWTYRDDSKWL